VGCNFYSAKVGGRALVDTLQHVGSLTTGAPTLAHRVADRYLPTIAQLEPETHVDKRPPRAADAAAAGSPPSTTDIARVAGTYYSPELDVTWSLAVSNGGLVLRQPRYPGSKLEARGADAFRSPGMTLHVERDQQGGVSGFSISAGRVRDIRFVRKTVTP
jgi:hypothetical protein